MLMNKQIIMEMLHSNINNIKSINKVTFVIFVPIFIHRAKWCSTLDIYYIFLYTYFNMILTTIWTLSIII